MDDFNNYLNKSNIQQRMRRFAADYLGTYRMDMLDPVIGLFLESLGEEIYKIVGEIDNLENRLLDKLSTMLVPNMETIAKPAHTILHTSSMESRVKITTQTEFRHSGLSFYPVCNTLIYKGDVRYYIYNGSLCSVNEDQTKMVMTGNGKKDRSMENSFRFGLELDSSVENISGLSFYIDFPDISSKSKYLNLLPYFEWKIGKQPVSMEKGLFSIREEPENDLLELYSACDFSCKMNRSVKESYDAHFFTVKDDFDIRDKKELFPESLRSDFSPKIMANFNQPLLWIEITCPAGFPPEILQSLQVCINAFPVINKQLISKTVDLNKTVPVIPLRTALNESFISVHSLVDSAGKLYYDVPAVKDADDTEYGIYSLRRGGCERYNTRDAKEYITGLVYQLSGEASAFFKNQNDVKNDLKKMEEEVNALVKQLGSLISETSDRYEVENYILVNPAGTENIFFITYWVTQYIDVNRIRAGIRFNPPPEIPLRLAVALSPAQGGKQAPMAFQKNDLYKKGLSKHCLLITNEDIENFCKENFRDFFTDIQIHRGWIKSKEPDIGFVKTTDVHLKSHKEPGKWFEKQDKNYFEQILREKSPATYTCRVFID